MDKLNFIFVSGHVDALPADPQDRRFLRVPPSRRYEYKGLDGRTKVLDLDDLQGSLGENERKLLKKGKR